MLPRSTNSRMGREAARGKQGGRTMEIQRLIGRSLRAVMDMKALPASPGAMSHWLMPFKACWTARPSTATR